MMIMSINRVMMEVVSTSETMVNFHENTQHNIRESCHLHLVAIRTFGVHLYLHRAVQWLRRLVAGLSPWRPVFAPGSVRVEYVVDHMALGQVVLRELWFCCISITRPWFFTLIYYLGMNNRPVGGCSSET
jgi:hypothetical protein